MDIISTLPIWTLAIAIFLLRIVDVSLGTIRTLAIVEGLTTIAVSMGFIEVLVWVVAVSQVISRINESFLLVLAYASGYAAGNAMGVYLEKKLAMGKSVLRIISQQHGDKIARKLREKGQVLTTFSGEGLDGPTTMLFAICERRKIRKLTSWAMQLDPDLFYSVERVHEWKSAHRHIPHATGWRAILKKK